jgi:phosphonate transport system permease protein
MSASSPPSRSLRDAFPANWTARALWLALAIYVVYAAGILQVTWARFVIGIDQGGKFLARMWPPNMQAQKLDLIWTGMLESLQIAVLATAVGVLLALPLGLLAARNLTPAWASWIGRTLIALFRTFHPVIVAILFVKAVGFGALAGVLALVIASMGFVGKLFAEAIEEISLKQIEAVRATGAPFASVVTFGVLPQVMFRFIGFAAYETDANLRNSTMVGIVGAGGIGGTLFAAFQRFDYDYVFAIVLSIIALIMVGELAQIWIKKVFRQ